MKADAATAGDVLRRIEPTSAAGPATLGMLAAAARIERIPPGVCLARRGRPLDTLYLVVEGEIEQSTFTRAGHRHVLVPMGPGHAVGLAAVIGPGTMHADLWSRDGLVALCVPARTFAAAFETDAGLARACALVLAARMRLLSEHMADVVALPPVARTARLLQRLTLYAKVDTAPGAGPRMRLTQAWLADALGVTRQSMNRVLQELERRGAVALRRGSIELADPDALSAAADPDPPADRRSSGSRPGRSD